MEKTKKKISDKESEISNKEDELILAKAKENDQYESMKKRIRFMYENGNTGFIEILCSSKSIGEFLNKEHHGMFLSMPVPKQKYAGGVSEGCNRCGESGSRASERIQTTADNAG